VAHNTYTELSAEAGLPALFLFLVFLTLAFRNLRRMRKSPGYNANPQIRLFTSALWASLAAYLVGAAFADTEYSLFPYFMVAYTSALYRIGASYTTDDQPPESTPNDSVRTGYHLDRFRWTASLAKQSYTPHRAGKC
jgi:hypothetical protein